LASQLEVVQDLEKERRMNSGGGSRESIIVGKEKAGIRVGKKGGHSLNGIGSTRGFRGGG